MRGPKEGLFHRLELKGFLACSFQHHPLGFQKFAAKLSFLLSSYDSWYSIVREFFTLPLQLQAIPDALPRVVLLHLEEDASEEEDVSYW